jgi:hypothetical protein
MKPRDIAVWLVVAALLGCGGGTTEQVASAPEDGQQGWRTVDLANLDVEQQKQLDRAAAAKDLLASTLMGALTEELEVGGPAGAVDICRDMAPMISAQTAEESGVRIGRTSYRLRNPDNRPPAWAEHLVERRVEGPTTLVGPSGELAVWSPIRLAKPCLECHGDPATMDPAVQAAIAEVYPDDRAVGFAEGDLRGWFWVEVPAES